MANNLGSLAVLGALGAAVYLGSTNALPPALQATWDKLMGGAAGANPGPSGGLPTAAQIQAWAQGINLPLWVGTLFVGDNGRLPQSIAELESWGASKSYRVNGSWIPPAGQS